MEASVYIQFFLAFSFVIGLILGLAYLLRRFGLGNGGMNALGRKKRISTIETAMVDARHKLVLVRRDNMEHLLLVGPGDSFVVERSIIGTADQDSPDSPTFQSALAAARDTAK